MPATSPAGPAAASKTVSPWVWAFRCLRWSTYLAVLITLILLLHKAPAPPVRVTPQAAVRAEQKVAQVLQSASQGEQATLRLDESELNSYLASHLNLAANPAPDRTNTSSPASDSPLAGNSASPVAAASDTLSPADMEQARSNVRDVKVQMEGDTVRAYVVFDVHGKDLTLQLAGRLSSADGFLKFAPISGQLGSLPIPQSTLESAVQRLMGSPENREKLRLPADVSEMHIENGELVATYH